MDVTKPYEVRGFGAVDVNKFIETAWQSEMEREVRRSEREKKVGSRSC